MPQDKSLLDIITKSPYFDDAWYRQEYTDIVYTKDCKTPAFHYLNYGWKEGRLPSVLFDTNRYLKIIGQTDECPLVHYINHGCRGLFIVPRYDEIAQKLKLGFDLTVSEKTLYMSALYQSRMNANFDIINNPTTLNEKVAWLNINYYDKDMQKLADKVERHAVVQEILGKDICIPAIATYKTVDEIEFDKLPNSFVIKLNCAPARRIMVTNKNKVSIDTLKEALTSWLKPENGIYYTTLERAYRDIEPRIIVEDYLQGTSATEPVPQCSIICSYDKVVCILMTTGNEGNATFFNEQGELLPYALSKGTPYLRNIDPSLKLTKKLNDLVANAKKISAKFPLVKVDFYICKGGKALLSDINFNLMGGLFNIANDGNFALGYKIDLPEQNLTDM